MRIKFGKPVGTRDNCELLPTKAFDVLGLGNGTLTLAIEILPGAAIKNDPFHRDSKLIVGITNAGEHPIHEISVDAYAPEGVLLVNPGILFGSTRRHVHIGKLNVGQTIKYKVGIRVKEPFQQGSLLIEMHQRGVLSEERSCKTEIKLISR